MADSTISGLPSASALTGTEVLPVDQSGTTKKTSASDVSVYVKSNIYQTAPNSYQVYGSGGTYYAINTRTGAIDSSSSDAGVVLRYATINAGAGGRVSLSKGTYNVNSFAFDSTDNVYYAVGLLPNNGTSGVPCPVSLVGEGAPAVYMETSSGPPSGGTIINITSTAMATLGGTDLAVGVWQLHDPGNTGNIIYLQDFGVLFPDNSRGNIHGINVTNALGHSFKNLYVGFNQAENSLVVSPAGASGCYGLVTHKSSHLDIAYMENIMSAGYHTSYRWDTEHQICVNTNSQYSTRAGTIGQSGGNIYHPLLFLNHHDLECINGIYIYCGGSHVQSGVSLSFIGYDQETQVAPSIWARSTYATEQTPGTTNGFITYTNVTAGVGVSSARFWEVGSGAKYQIFQGTADGPTIPKPTVADFTNSNHSHTNAAGGGTLSESSLALTDITTNNSSTLKHGFLKKLPNDATQYMDGTGNWSVPSGGGGGVTPSGARVYNASNTAVADSTLTAIPYTSERYDTDSYHDNATNNTRLTIPATGYYLVATQGQFQNTASGTGQIYIRVNGTTYIAQTILPFTITSNVAGGISTVWSFTAGDYVETIVYQTSGGSLNYENGLSAAPEFMIQRLH